MLDDRKEYIRENCMHIMGGSVIAAFSVAGALQNITTGDYLLATSLGVCALVSGWVTQGAYMNLVNTDTQEMLKPGRGMPRPRPTPQ